nr:hypothetical protein [uncultured Rhodopila sp.]
MTPLEAIKLAKLQGFDPGLQQGVATLGGRSTIGPRSVTLDAGSATIITS